MTSRPRTGRSPAKPAKAQRASAQTPWAEGNPEKKIGINVPFPEPLMLQLDYLIENRAITSKSSFIRDSVAAAATVEVEKLRRLQEAMRRIEQEDRARR